MGAEEITRGMIGGDGVAKSPKAFISHASEDKERFVRVFAERLRERGVDAWVDEWEIYPGDSLIDKIFEEGLKDADAVIVVISQYSIDKPWVREELNAAVVKRINRGGRLIPVVLDDAEVPEVLKNTVWVKIADLTEYARDFDRIVSAIFDHRPKPPLGKPPAYVTSPEPAIPGLSPIDVTVLRAFAENALEKGSTFSIATEDRWLVVNTNGITREDYEDALEMLDKRGYLERSRVVARVPPHFSLTVPGLETYLRKYDSSYPQTFTNVGLAILNEGLRSNHEITAATVQPRIIVDHILRVMEMKRYIKVARVQDGLGTASIYELSAELKRMLRENSGA
jgi:hypothetical protein